jgi:bifunctional non-homologous end joining protein LigD
MGAVRKRTTATPTSARVRLTHPERVLFNKPRVTKADLADFYTEIAAFILPQLINRPLMLLRCPDGAAGPCFFQKHVGRTLPPAIAQIDDPQDGQRWIYVKDLDGLLGLVQMSVLELHVWGCSVRDLERANRLVIDLDPGARVSWTRVIEAALELRGRLSQLKLQSFVRTSGGKGLHVVIPLRPATPWDAARSFVRALAEQLQRDQPERYLAVASKAARSGRIFVDYLRNGRGATAVCSYSLRNRPRAPIATPLSWDELPRVTAPDEFRFETLRERLRRLRADPWQGIDSLRQSLPVGG